MSGKFFSLVLHSHIPYVLAHGSWPHGMDWLYEAAAETYLPLLDVFERLAAEGISARTSVSFTPVLMEQLKDPVFVKGFDEYLRMKIAIAACDAAAFERTGNAALLPLATRWEAWYRKLLEDFHGRSGGDIIGAFRSLQDRGHIEVLTSAATHGYLALLSRDESIRQQVRQGLFTYRKYFGREPLGFWIPECAYRPGYAWKNPLGDGDAVSPAGRRRDPGPGGPPLLLRRFPPAQGRRGQGRLHRPVPGSEAPLGKVSGPPTIRPTCWPGTRIPPTGLSLARPVLRPG